MSWGEFAMIWLATVVMASVQLAGWIGCFCASWQMVFVYGPTEYLSSYTLGWMIAFGGLAAVGLHWLKRSLYWFDRVAHFRAWKGDLDRCYGRGGAGFG